MFNRRPYSTTYRRSKAQDHRLNVVLSPGSGAEVCVVSEHDS